MNCPHCKHPCADGRNYCGACGSPLVRFCPRCGFRNGLADHYCGGCGSPLGDAPPRPELRPSAARPVAPAVPAPAPDAGPAMAGMADLLEAARETEEVAQQDADVKVSQDDIDSLFGD
ncbi:MAG: zinc ribbon domain-containing protein [Deferrisomatales bacterium]|nr:zinc ribbon domain-containing protein [Deferrisomatales bacterium]